MVTLAHMRRLLPAVIWIAWLTPTGYSQDAPARKPLLSDADNFFIEYQRAAGLLAQDKPSEAALVMAELSQRLTASPWLEITVLKRCQLLEQRSPEQALDDYAFLAKRLTAKLYYQNETAAILRAALRDSAERGVSRIRLKRIDDALGKYFTRFGKYPESLAVLATYNMFINPADLVDIDQRPFRYTPKSLKLPQMNYMAYDLEFVPADPFIATAPRIQSITRIGENPDQYAVRLQTHPRKNPELIKEGQTIEGYYVAVVAARGAILCSNDRVLVLPVAP